MSHDTKNLAKTKVLDLSPFVKSVLADNEVLILVKGSLMEPFVVHTNRKLNSVKWVYTQCLAVITPVFSYGGG